MTKMYSILFLVMLTMGAANRVFSTSKLSTIRSTKMAPSPAGVLNSYEPMGEYKKDSLYE